MRNILSVFITFSLLNGNVFASGSKPVKTEKNMNPAAKVVVKGEKKKVYGATE